MRAGRRLISQRELPRLNPGCNYDLLPPLLPGSPTFPAAKWRYINQLVWFVNPHRAVLKNPEQRRSTYRSDVPLVTNDLDARMKP
jgi:hypothetical protein